MITMIPVKSSTILFVGYDEETRKMRVEFQTSIYEYEDVEPECFESFLKSESKGTFLNEYIKDKYNYKRV